ncbi:MAG: hypothetical protein AAGK21_07365 [Bacteroidota bacterium]
MALAALASGSWVGCSDSVDPTLGLDVPFSLYGYLDPTADRQGIRVVPIAESINADSVSIDAAVSSTDLETGETLRWRDSLVTFADSSIGHVFVADFTPRPGSTIQVDAQRSDGAVSTATVSVPSISEPVVGQEMIVGGDIGYPVQITGAPRIVRSAFSITVGGHPDDPPGTFRRIEIPIRNEPQRVADGTWVVDVPFVSAIRRQLERLGLLGTGLGIVSAEHSFFVADEGWDLPSLDPDALAEPGTFSNVDAGLGFVGSGYTTTVQWLPSSAAARAAGFPVSTDAAEALVLNEIRFNNPITNEAGWVEFYNPTQADISLRGYSLTNDASRPRLQPFVGDVVVPARGYYVHPLDFEYSASQQRPELALYGRAEDLVLNTPLLPLLPDEGDGGYTYGSYPDGRSRIVRRTIGLEERIYDIYRGPLTPTPNAPNEFGLDVAYINEVYTEGTQGWVETVTVRAGLDSIRVISEGAPPGALWNVSSKVRPTGANGYGVADEEDPGLVLPQIGDTVQLLVFFDDRRIRQPLVPDGAPPLPIDLDRRFQIRVVDSRRYDGQSAGRSVGYLPQAPDGVWTPDLQPTRGTPNASSRRAL